MNLVCGGIYAAMLETMAFQPNVASLPVPIFIAYSKRKKVAPQLSGEQKKHHKQPDKGHIIIW